MCKLHCVVRVKCVFVAQRRQDVCGQTHPHHRVLQRSYKVPMVNTLSRVSVLFGIRNEWTAVVISKLQVSSHPAFLHFSVFCCSCMFLTLLWPAQFFLFLSAFTRSRIAEIVVSLLFTKFLEMLWLDRRLLKTTFALNLWFFLRLSPLILKQNHCFFTGCVTVLSSKKQSQSTWALMQGTSTTVIILFIHHQTSEGRVVLFMLAVQQHYHSCLF